MNHEVWRLPTEELQFLNTPKAFLEAMNNSNELIGLGSKDVPWLAKISQLHETKIDDEWLEDANKAAAIGSLHLHSHSSPPERAVILSSREYFFGEALGLANEFHPLHNSYKLFFRESAELLGPPLTTIETMRLLHSENIECFGMLRHNFSILRKRSKTALATINAYKSHGFDASEIINLYPPTINLSPERIDERITDMVEIGYDDVSELIKVKPQFLTYSKKRLKDHSLLAGSLGHTAAFEARLREDKEFEEKSNIFDKYEVDYAETAKKHSFLFGLSAEDIENRLAVPKKYGLLIPNLLKVDPGFLRRNASELDERIDTIRAEAVVMRWNGDITLLMNECVELLTSSDEELAVRAELFKYFGKSEMSNEEVGGLIKIPLESHFITIALRKDYELNEVKEVNEQFDAEKKVELMARIIAKRNKYAPMISPGLIKLYKACTEAKKSGSRTKPV